MTSWTFPSSVGAGFFFFFFFFFSSSSSDWNIQMDLAKVSAVTTWPVPDSRKRLQQFLGFANFYNRFIRDYSTITAPLTALTSSKVSFSWTPVTEEAFQTLKTWFTSAPILWIPDLDRQFVVDVDASVGAVRGKTALRWTYLSPLRTSKSPLHPLQGTLAWYWMTSCPATPTSPQWRRCYAARPLRTHPPGPKSFCGWNMPTTP